MGKHRIAVVGGGFTGLAAATVLSQKNDVIEVDLFEKNSHLGGLAAGFKEPGWNSALEYYYHHWFDSDQSLKKFAALWGATEKLCFKDLLTVIETRAGGFVPLDSAMALLKYPALDLPDKLRMGVVLAYLKATRSWKTLERVTAEEWCIRYMGEKGFNEIWKPLLVGKFGPQYASVVNMAWLWARITARTKKLGTYRGGFQALVEDVAAYLHARGVQIRLSCGDLAIDKSDSPAARLRVRNSAGDAGQYSAVLMATSPFAFVKATEGLVSPDLGPTLLDRPSLGVQVVILSLREALNSRQKNYWYSLRKREDQPFLALVEHTHFVPETEFGGEHIVYLANYVDPGEPDWRLSDDELRALALPTCRRINPEFDPASIRRSWVFRERYAQPLMLKDASRDLPPIRIPGVEGLYFGSMAHVYPWHQGTNFALELGERIAWMMLEDLGLR